MAENSSSSHGGWLRRRQSVAVKYKSRRSADLPRGAVIVERRDRWKANCTKLKKLEKFIDQCKANPFLLSDHSLSFFRDYIERDPTGRPSNNLWELKPISDAKPSAEKTSSRARVSTAKYRNYAVVAGTITILGALGWYFMSKDKKSEEVHD